MRRLAVPFLLVAVLAGCSSTEPGKPSAGEQTGSAPTTGTSAGTAPVSRPKNVDMLKLDPCSLITPEVKTALKMRLAAENPPDSDFGEGSRACGINYEDRTYTTAIHTLVNGGVDRLKRTVGESELTQLQVGGYPAYLDETERKNIGPGCDIYVDVNDDQMLLLTAGAFGEPKATVAGACELVKKFANAVGPGIAAK